MKIHSCVLRLASFIALSLGSANASLIIVDTNTGTVGVSGHVRLGANETSSFGGTQFHVKNSGDANTTTRKGYMRFDTGGVLGGSVTSASLDLVVSLTAVAANQTIHVYGLTDETLDSWDPSHLPCSWHWLACLGR